MHILLTTLLLTLATAQAAVLTDGLLAASDTSGTNATVRSVTISAQTNLLAGTLTATNNLTVGGDTALAGGLSVGNNITNSAAQAYSVMVTSSTKVLASLTPAANPGALLASSGAGASPTWNENFLAPASSTNASLVGVMTANGVNATNFLRLNGVDVMTTSSSANDVRGSGTTAANDLAVFTDTTHTNIARSTSAANLGDSSSATFAVNFGLSGATDPVITAGNNLLTVSTPLTSGDVTLSGASAALNFNTTSTALQRSGGALVYSQNSSGRWTANLDNFNMTATGGSFSIATDTYLSRDSAGVIKVTSNGTTLSGLKAGTLTLTPAAADTTALTVSGGSTTGSGTTKAATFSHTANTSGNIDGVYTFTLVDTVSGASTFHSKWLGGAAGTTVLGSLSKGGALTVNGGITFGGVLIFNAAADLLLRYESAAVLQMGTDSSSPINQKFKANDGSGTDIAGASLTIAGGQSTGTGRGGAAIIQTSPSGSTGSSANAYSERAHYAAKAVTLTESTATTVATIALTAAQFIGAQFTVTVFASDGTDHQSRTLRFGVSAVNKAGTVTAAIDTPDESVAVSAGTLTATITAVANGNAVDVKVDATSSLTQTTLNATVAIPAINGNGTAAVTEI